MRFIRFLIALTALTLGACTAGMDSGDRDSQAVRNVTIETVEYIDGSAAVKFINMGPLFGTGYPDTADPGNNIWPDSWLRRDNSLFYNG